MTGMAGLARLRTDPELQRIARGGLTALLIKGSAAGLSFLMFLVLARAMTVEEFGRLGFVFSAATLLAVLGSLGQRALAMRYVAIYRGIGAEAKARGVVEYGYRRVVAGCGGLVLILAGAALVHGPSMSYLIAGAALVLAVGLAEFQAHVLRAEGGMTLAVLPRDVVWRVIVMLAAGVAAVGAWPEITASAAIWIMALTLLIIIAAQAVWSPLLRSIADRSDRDWSEIGQWQKAQWGLWGVSVIQPAVPNLALVALGLLLSPAETAPVFAALRTAMVLHLFLMAANMIAAPLISRHVHADDMQSLQRLCTVISAAVTLPTFLVFVAFILAGDRVLGLFGSGFESGHVALVIFSAGYLVSAVAGSTAQIMEMAGFERRYFRVLLIATIAALALLWPLIALLGSVGAALAVAGYTMSWNVVLYVFIARQLGINAGLLRLAGHKP